MDAANSWNTAIAYLGGFILFGIIGFWGSLLIIGIYDSERPMETDPERRQKAKDAEGRVSIRVGLFLGAAWILYRFLSK